MSCSEKRWQSLRFTDLYKIWQHVLDLESLSFTGRLQPADKFLNYLNCLTGFAGALSVAQSTVAKRTFAIKSLQEQSRQNMSEQWKECGRYHLVSKVEAHGSTLAYSIQCLSSQQERILKFCPNVSKKQATEWATQLGLGVNERKHGSTEVAKRLLTIARSHGFPCHVFSIKQEPRRSEIRWNQYSWTKWANLMVVPLCLLQGCDMLRRTNYQYLSIIVKPFPELATNWKDKWPKANLFLSANKLTRILYVDSLMALCRLYY